MTETQQRAIALLPLVQAAAAGRIIEHYSRISKTWHPPDSALCGGLSFGDPIECYRIKPEPVTRPWSKPEDVPGSVCWMRGARGTGVNDVQRFVTIVNSTGVSFSHGGEVYWARIPDWEYSTDRKTWQPCVVTEAQP